ncbi:g4074 [Coccomyxa elongata]
MLSAGVMISAGLVHLLGTAIKELDPMKRFPLAPFLCGLGFLVTLVADQVAGILSERNGWHGDAAIGHCHSPAMAHEHSSDMTLLQHVLVVDPTNPRVKAVHNEGSPDVRAEGGKSPRAASKVFLEVEDGSLQTTGAAEGGEHVPNGNVIHSAFSNGGENEAGGEDGRGASASASASPYSNPQSTVWPSKSGHLGEGRAGNGVMSGIAAASGVQRGNLMQRTASLPPTSRESETIRLVEGIVDSVTGEVRGQAGASAGASGRSPQPGAPEQLPAVATVSFLTAALMGVALCFHSVLEGMAMGAQANIVDSVHIFIAIAAHKGLAAYALGSSVVDSQASMRKFWTVIGFFASATPVGILLGVLLSSVSNSDAAASVSALASGTFLYVAFMEVIPKELAVPSHRTSKLVMLMSGFAAMSLLAIWA